MQRALAPLAFSVYASALKLDTAAKERNAVPTGRCPFGFDVAQTEEQHRQKNNRQKKQKTEEDNTVDTEVVDTEVSESEVVDTEVSESEVVDPEVVDPEVVDEEVVDEEEVDEEVVDTAADFISDFFNLDGAITTTLTLSTADYEEVFMAVVNAFDWESNTFIDNENAQGRFVGCLLRTAGHDFMDYRYDAEVLETGIAQTGGSDGCINMEDEDNTGLEACLNMWGIPAVFDSVKDHVSLADFFVIAGEAAAARSHQAANPADMFEEGSLAQRFRDGFKFGRTTQTTCEWTVGRMPNPENGCQGDDAEGVDGLKQIFVDNIYNKYSDQDAWGLTAAIMGAHTVGKASLENSGYDGHWSDSESQGYFNNDYYSSLLLKGWGPELAVDGNDGKNQWSIVDSTLDVNGHKEMMLNTDLCLLYSHTQAKNCEDAKRGTDWQDFRTTDVDIRKSECYFNENHSVQDLKSATADGCCAWVRTKAIFDRNNFADGGVLCGEAVGERDVGPNESVCCEHSPDPRLDCDSTTQPQGPAAEMISDFVRDEEIWLKKYLESWHVGTENGYADGILQFLTESGETRHDYSDLESVDCLNTADACSPGPSGLFYRDGGPCQEIIVVTTSHETDEFGGPALCLNNMRPVIEQRPEFVSSWMYQWMNTVYLEGAASSSQLTGDYSADKVLNRQDRLTTESRSYNLHAQLNDTPWASSCAVTETNDSSSYWNAQFTNGSTNVAWVQVRFANDEPELLNGALIYIGETQCGTVDSSLAQLVDDVPVYQNIVCAQAACTDASAAAADCLSFTGGVTGDSITIQKEGQMAVCDVVVYKGERFPLAAPEIIG